TFLATGVGAAFLAVGFALILALETLLVSFEASVFLATGFAATDVFFGSAFLVFFPTDSKLFMSFKIIG
ncbi:MAG TPA: hypothetical protein PK355_08005, partial [Chitinophagales bacterium]|nr:hypothetical protein [Chitinophagales bacterium]